MNGSISFLECTDICKAVVAGHFRCRPLIFRCSRIHRVYLACYIKLVGSSLDISGIMHSGGTAQSTPVEMVIHLGIHGVTVNHSGYCFG